MKKLFFVTSFIFCILGSFLLILGSTSQKNSDAEHEWLPVNFYGELEDTEGNKNQVENISFSGEYKNIPFYIKPKNSLKDPSSNYEKINLKDIAEIRLSKRDARESLYTFKHKDYMEVLVSFKSSVPNHEKTYIIERNKKIICYRMENNQPVLKQLSIDSLLTLTIKGYKEQKEGAFGPLEQQCIDKNSPKRDS